MGDGALTICSLVLQVGYDFEVLPSMPTAPPSEGVYIHGLFLEGCGWDSTARQLAESAPKVGNLAQENCACYTCSEHFAMQHVAFAMLVA